METVFTPSIFSSGVGAYGVTSATGCAIYGTLGAVIIAVIIVLSALGTQKVAAALPRPTDTFKFRAITRELNQIFQSIKNKNFAAWFSTD